MEPDSSTVSPKGSSPELREIDRRILAFLDRDGRATPRYLTSELGEQQSYVSQRLTFLVDEADLVKRVDRGLYELDCEVIYDGFRFNDQ